MSTSAATSPAIQGELQRQGSVVIGWCWSPDRPTRRLTVELMVEGRQVAAAVAARMRLDLVRDGVRDGYHGFTLPLPPDIRASEMVEARERETGRVFGRLLGAPQADLLDWTARCRALSREVAGMQRRALRISDGVGPTGLLAAPGVRLARRHAAPGGAPNGLRLPHHAAPTASLLLDAVGASEACLSAIVALAPVLSWTGAEVVIADHGRGPASGRLASLRGLTLAPGHGDAADRLNATVLAARAPMVAFLDPAGFGALGVAALLHAAGASPGALAGAGLASAARRAGLDVLGPPMKGPAVRTGLWLLVAADVFNSLGGLDPTLEDGAGLPMLDLALRLARHGEAPRLWPDLPWRAPTPGTGVADARQRFAGQWLPRRPDPRGDLRAKPPP